MKQIIILEAAPTGDGRRFLRCVYWFPVPAGKEEPEPGFNTAYAGATAAEVDALKAGTVKEEVRELGLPVSLTTAQIKGALVADYNDRKAYLDALPFRLQFFGVFFDGAAWSA